MSNEELIKLGSIKDHNSYGYGSYESSIYAYEKIIELLKENKE